MDAGLVRWVLAVGLFVGACATDDGVQPPAPMDDTDAMDGAESHDDSGDVGSDGVWDVWQLESPKMVWYFRGSPHVHVWANIRA